MALQKNNATFSERCGTQVVTLFVLLLITFLITPSRLCAQEECFKKNSYNYCVHRGHINTIAYYFHGKFSDEHSWGGNPYFSDKIRGYWSKNKLDSPTVVSISFGSAWLLTPKTQLQDSGLLEKFTDQVLPEVEKQIGKPKRRIIFGNSMGGLNSLILGLSHPELFKKAAALCPGIYDISLYKWTSAVTEWIQKVHADPKIIEDFVSLSRKYVSNDSEWNKISPIALLEKYPNTQTQFYLWSGINDKHGNYEGSKIFAEKAKQKGINIQWISSQGGHCTELDIPSIAKFLTD